MKRDQFGALGSVSRLTLGGGGIGQGWGPTSREEAIATIKAAVDAGIDLLDTAPLYRNCETIVAETFGGRLPSGLRVTTKCGLGSPEPHQVERALTQSLENSLAAMKLNYVDIFFLHSNICADDYVYANRPDLQNSYATRWTLYAEHVIPTMEKLKATGKIKSWGITGSGVPDAIIRALRHTKPPSFVQAVTNLLDSAGSLRRYSEPARPREIISVAIERGVGVLGSAPCRRVRLPPGLTATFR